MLAGRSSFVLIPFTAMTKFLSGPPGGRTLPLQPPRLSDLDGVYSPGASAASTGLNAGCAVIKTANTCAAGETWDDLLEYYLVRRCSPAETNLYSPAVVQHRPRIDGLCVPPWQDLLPRRYIRCSWRRSIQRRWRKHHATRLPPRTLLLPPHRTARPSQPSATGPSIQGRYLRSNWLPDPDSWVSRTSVPPRRGSEAEPRACKDVV